LNLIFAIVLVFVPYDLSFSQLTGGLIASIPPAGSDWKIVKSQPVHGNKTILGYNVTADFFNCMFLIILMELFFL
jgi:hypothetical protein